MSWGDPLLSDWRSPRIPPNTESPMPMKNERNVHGFKEGSSWTEMIWVTMSRSLCRTRLSGPVIDSTSVAEYSRAFSGVLQSACFSLESVDSAAEGGFDITTVERERTPEGRA